MAVLQFSLCCVTLPVVTHSSATRLPVPSALVAMGVSKLLSLGTSTS